MNFDELYVGQKVAVRIPDEWYPMISEMISLSVLKKTCLIKQGDVLYAKATISELHDNVNCFNLDNVPGLWNCDDLNKYPGSLLKQRIHKN